MSEWNLAIDKVLSGLKSEDDSVQLRAIYASVEALRRPESTSRKGYSPTEAESEAIGRTMMEAAHAALGVLPHNDDFERAQIARRIVSAIIAAKDAEQGAKVALLAIHDDCEYVSEFPETLHVVASAYSAWLYKTAIDDMHPYSITGGSLVAFAEGAVAATHFQTACDGLHDGEVVYVSGDHAGGLKALLGLFDEPA